ncbi:cytidine deaminase-like protein [Pseudoneurospora amorphoporcata]|uniref:Cytidine deaminase n=1 Tax=Pseudoneurospora amorphoporcata TaxID=241081 RepID=A0AAN6SES3_9PEZI|nr:cytidine deaminase-like protein [Pseudoneurospora amorphoporcata]
MAPPTPPILSGHDDSVIADVCKTYNLTPSEFAQLRDRAVAAKAISYSPYSKFRVGAVLLSNGRINPLTGERTTTEEVTYTPGANVENASYPVTTCAERVAFGRAITEGHRGFRAVAVATDISPPASPCGMCRQFIREFCELSMPILMFDKDENFSVLRLEDLLPLSFGPDQMGVESA